MNENSRDGGSSAQCVPTGVLTDGELVGVGLPDVLGVIVVLGRHNDSVGHEERGVETHTKLADHLWGGVPLWLHLRHLVEELTGTRLGNGAQVPHELFFGHTNTSVGDVEHILLFVRLGIVMLEVSYQKSFSQPVKTETQMQN